ARPDDRLGDQCGAAALLPRARAAGAARALNAPGTPRERPGAAPSPGDAAAAPPRRRRNPVPRLFRAGYGDRRLVHRRASAAPAAAAGGAAGLQPARLRRALGADFAARRPLSRPAVR